MAPCRRFCGGCSGRRWSGKGQSNMVAAYKEKAAALARAGGHCEKCGSEGVARGRRSHLFEVHHVQPGAENGGNERENLLVLCLDCHDAERAAERRRGLGGCSTRYPKRLMVFETERGLAILRALAARWE